MCNCVVGCWCWDYWQNTRTQHARNTYATRTQHARTQKGEHLGKEIVAAKDMELEARLEQIRAAQEAHKKLQQEQVRSMRMRARVRALVIL